MQRLRPSLHAIDRYRQRVDQTATADSAAAALCAIGATAHACPRPRRWMRVAGYRPGVRYMYSAQYPGIGLVVAGDVITTVFSRQVCARWRAEAARYAPVPRIQTTPRRRAVRGGRTRRAA